MASKEEAKTRKELIDPKLKASGWDKETWQVEWEYKITNGRIQFDGKNARRERPIYADYLLRYKPSTAIAIVEAKPKSISHLEGEKQAKNYAEKLGLWFAYATNGVEIEFYDLKAGTQKTVPRFHTPEELWDMYLIHSGLKTAKKESIDALLFDYFDESQIGQRRIPRYYQELAVRNALESIFKGKRRVLITQATGTGKTFTSIQLVYKLWKAKAVKKILFIVDRNLLADQAFKDFDNAMDRDACYRLMAKDEKFPLSRDLYFGIYQTLVGLDDEGGETGRPDRYKEFPSDFFDLIVIDEAHRGAANVAGSWFRLLNYFKSAIQVGLTATPRRDESVDTYKYFGNSVVNYSLKNGIEDGFLAPYIIKRVTSNIDSLGYRPEHSGIKDVSGKILEVKDYYTPNYERELSIPQRTKAFAYHLMRHLFSTDPLGKTIVFCLDQAHALDMAKFVNEAFNAYKEKYNFDYDGKYATRITGNDKDPHSGKYPFLEKFQDVESYEPIVVTTSKLLTTGVDVRNIKNIVIFRNIGSMVEFKQIIGRGTRIYDHPNKDREKLGFFILEYANYSTSLFNDPEWDDEPIDIIDDGKIEIPEKEIKEVPTGDHEPKEVIDSKGIYKEPDEEEEKRIRYRMSEEFLSGRIKIAAESISFTGPDGKPLSAEQFVLYQSNQFLQNIPSIKALNEIWKDIKTRKDFIEIKAFDLGLNIDALTQLFFEKHKLRNVDLYDIFANMFLGQEYLTKDQRILKAKEINSSFFKNKPERIQELINDMLEVYLQSDFRPFETSKEFFETTLMKKYGRIGEIQTLLGGSENLKTLVTNLQGAIYDERIAA